MAFSDITINDVAPYYPEYLEAREKVLARSGNGIATNDYFHGLIRGVIEDERIMNTPVETQGGAEGVAIYRLQGLHRLREHDRAIAAKVAEGWRDVADLTDSEKKRRPASILIIGPGERCRDWDIREGRAFSCHDARATHWQEVEGGRIIWGGDGSPEFVMRKGARTRGYRVEDWARVLVFPK